MYERTVDVPCFYAMLPEDGADHPVLETIRSVLSQHYDEEFSRTSTAYYRDSHNNIA